MSANQENLNRSMTSNVDFKDYLKQSQQSESIASYSSWLSGFNKINIVDEYYKDNIFDAVSNIPDLQNYLVDFGLASTLFKGKEFDVSAFLINLRYDPAYVGRVINYWIHDQATLIETVTKEMEIDQKLGEGGRAFIQEQLAELSSDYAPYIQFINVKHEAIQLIEKSWNPEKTDVAKILNELNNKYIEVLPTADQKTITQYKEIIKRLKEYKKEENKFNELHEKLNKDIKNINRLNKTHQNAINQSSKEVVTDLKGTRKDVYSEMEKKLNENLGLMNTRNAMMQGDSDNNFAIYQEYLNTKSEIQDRMNEPVIEGMEFYASNEDDCLEIINQLEQEGLLINMDDVKSEDRENQIFTKKLILLEGWKLHRNEGFQKSWSDYNALGVEKDDNFMAMLILQNRVNAFQQAYEKGIKDEKAFQAELDHQLILLKTLPKLPRAMNVYCSSYKASFYLFLGIGNYIAGEGKALGNTTGQKLGNEAIELFKKLPFYTGILDLEKSKAFDTGFMEISLKLGLGFGVAIKAVEATVGLALEISGGIYVNDFREFETSYGVALKAVAEAKIPKIFQASLEIEIANFTRGTAYQDHYHWAACMAHFWGRAIAKTVACEIYVKDNPSQLNQTPNSAVLSELDKLADQIFNTNKEFQDIHAISKEYLGYSVWGIRRNQVGLIGMGVTAKSLVPLPHSDTDDGTFTINSIHTFDIPVLNSSNPKITFNPQAELNLSKEATEIYRTHEEKGEIVEEAFDTETNQGTVQLAALISGNAVKTENDPRILKNNSFVNFSLVTQGSSNIAKFFDEAISNTIKSKEAIEAKSSTKGQEVQRWLVDQTTYSFKLAAQVLLTYYAKPFLEDKCHIETTKKQWVTASLAKINSTHPDEWWFKNYAIQYVRANVLFENKFEQKINIYHGLYIDVGVEFNYQRSSGEMLGWNTIYYLLVVYNGLMDRANMSGNLKQVDISHSGTMRPESLSGSKIWDAFVNAHKDEIWHLFLSIADKNHPIRHEIEYYGNQVGNNGKTNALIQKCERIVNKEQYLYSTARDAMFRFLLGVAGVTNIEPASAALVGLKHLLNEWNKRSAKNVQTKEKSLVDKVFKNYLDEEILKKSEASDRIPLQELKAALDNPANANLSVDKIIDNVIKDQESIKNNFQQYLKNKHQEIDSTFSAIKLDLDAWLQDVRSGYVHKREHNAKGRRTILKKPESTHQAIFKPQDQNVLGFLYSAKLLHEKTGKALQVCKNCLADNHVRNHHGRAELLLSMPIAPQKFWVADKDSEGKAAPCPKCGTGKGLSKGGRHHCRICGDIFCGSHISQITLQDCRSISNGAITLKACEDCIQKLHDREEMQRMRSVLPVRKLAELTHKDSYVCMNCLHDVEGDFVEALTRLTVAVVPEDYWVKDAQTDKCQSGHCKAKLTMRHRHHCRICGGYFCDNHAKEITLPTRYAPKTNALKRAFTMPGLSNVKKGYVCDYCTSFMQGNGLDTMLESAMFLGMVEYKPSILPKPTMPKNTSEGITNHIESSQVPDSQFEDDPEFFYDFVDEPEKGFSTFHHGTIEHWANSCYFNSMIHLLATRDEYFNLFNGNAHQLLAPENDPQIIETLDTHQRTALDAWQKDYKTGIRIQKSELYNLINKVKHRVNIGSSDVEKTIGFLHANKLFSGSVTGQQDPSEVLFNLFERLQCANSPNLSLHWHEAEKLKGIKTAKDRGKDYWHPIYSLQIPEKLAVKRNLSLLDLLSAVSEERDTDKRKALEADLNDTALKLDGKKDYVYTKSDRFTHLPDIMTIAIARFSGVKKYVSPIIVPEELEIPKACLGEGVKSVKYRLIHFIYHRGASASSGHYIPYVKSENEWEEYDDMDTRLKRKIPKTELETHKNTGYVYTFVKV